MSYWRGLLGSLPIVLCLSHKQHPRVQEWLSCPHVWGWLYEVFDCPYISSLWLKLLLWHLPARHVYLHSNNADFNNSICWPGHKLLDVTGCASVDPDSAGDELCWNCCGISNVVDQCRQSTENWIECICITFRVWCVSLLGTRGKREILCICTLVPVCKSINLSIVSHDISMLCVYLG